MIPLEHPRFYSLSIRERLVNGFKNGYVAAEGLIAHGRGETFDYLIGEQTSEYALDAIHAASAVLLLADYPVISVNGNTVALCAQEIYDLNNSIEKSKVEINLFYHTIQRETLITQELTKYGLTNILGTGQKEFKEIPELKSNRRRVDPDGIYKADVIFVPLEDGDRTLALKKINKIVITVDLNPLSRTAIAADITIVDNIVRALPKLVEAIEYNKNLNKDDLKKIVKTFDNKSNLKKSLQLIKRID